MVGEDAQTLGAGDRAVAPRDGEYLDAVVGPLLRPGGEHLGAVEDQDPDSPPAHAPRSPILVRVFRLVDRGAAVADDVGA
jgi:hypothetical protein